jgi:hypothetical protein
LNVKGEAEVDGSYIKVEAREKSKPMVVHAAIAAAPCEKI